MNKINKETTIPPDNRGRPTIYKFDSIEIGEYFFVKRTVRQANSAYQQYRKKNPDYRANLRAFKNGCRIYRVEPIKTI
jgi:hypothetical protein